MKLKILSAILLSGLGLAACGGDDPAPAGFPQPAGTVAVNFTIDDTANKAFTASGQMQWKGSMAYDTSTRKITKDSTWTGPFAPLYDDGPWNTGGHEPAGAVANDNKWGVTVFATPPATGSDTYEYGLINHAAGDGWIWSGSNGTFAVAAGATAAVTATGQALKKFGTADIQLKIDKSALLAGTTWDTTKVTVKGSGWAWQEVTLTAAGNIYTFTLSDVVGAGKTFSTLGLLSSGDKPEFIFVFNGKEYKAADGTAAVAGVTAFTRAATTGTFAAATIAIAGNKNSYVTIP